MSPVTVAFAGDVMIGRGVDQIMRHPGDPTLHESWACSSLRYVELAEEKSGPMPRAVEPGYVWGNTPRLLDDIGVDVRVVNLETALTVRGQPWPNKGIHYRAHPDNADCLLAGGIDVAVVANNHILDWSEPGLIDTVDTLDRLGVGRAGAGRDRNEAWRPASVVVGESSRILVFGMGSPSSGLDPAWAAGCGHPGVALVESLSDLWVDRMKQTIDRRRQPGDVVVVSIHWGSNWGYRIPGSHRRFARALVDQAGVDVVHGHSSHHSVGFEIYRGHLILYGCGDLLTDYEGIQGHEMYRPELGGWYIASFDHLTGDLRSLGIVPTKVQRFQLVSPSQEELEWLASRFREHSLPPGLRVDAEDGHLCVEW